MTDDRRPAPPRPAAPVHPAARPAPGAVPVAGRGPLAGPAGAKAQPQPHGIVITKVAPETRLAVAAKDGGEGNALADLVSTLDPAAAVALADGIGRFLLIVLGDGALLRALLDPVADIEDVSERYGTLRLGGPQAPVVLRRILRADVGDAPLRASWGGIAVDARREGDEVRLTVPIDRSADFLAAVMRISLPYGVKAVGERVHTGPVPRPPR